MVLLRLTSFNLVSLCIFIVSLSLEILEVFECWLLMSNINYPNWHWSSTFLSVACMTGIKNFPDTINSKIFLWHGLIVLDVKHAGEEISLRNYGNGNQCLRQEFWVW